MEREGQARTTASGSGGGIFFGRALMCAVTMARNAFSNLGVPGLTPVAATCSFGDLLR